MQNNRKNNIPSGGFYNRNKMVGLPYSSVGTLAAETSPSSVILDMLLFHLVVFALENDEQ